MHHTSQLWHTILEYGKVSHSFVPNIDLYNTIGQTVQNEDVYLFAAGPSMPRQCLEKYLMSAMSPCLLVTRRPRISSAVKVTLAASTRVSLNPGQCTITWPCILHTEDQSVLTTPFLLKFFLFTSSDKFEGDHHCFFGLLDHVFVHSWLPVDSSSAARTHSTQSTDIYTCGTHETPEFNDHRDDDIIRYNTP